MSICATMPLTPSSVTLFYEGGNHCFTKLRKDLVCRAGEMELRYGSADDAPYMRVAITGKDTGLLAISIHWNFRLGTSAQLLGDEWGELDGNAQWRGLDPLRRFPWYVLIATPGGTNALGVLTSCAAFAQWSVNSAGVELMLDIRSGRRGVKLNGRHLEVATIISRRYDLMPLAACRTLCEELSPEPILPSLPVYGNCDGFYAYGKSSMDSILRDADELSELTTSLTNRPYEIIDLGWQSEDAIHSSDIWIKGNERFPDMPKLAELLCTSGIRPGIALHLLQSGCGEEDKKLINANGSGALDPSCPEVIDIVQGAIHRMADWGFQLIKHEFSTHDILGNDWQPFNPEHKGDLEGAGWTFYDQSRTSAEIIREFYRAIRGAMGDMVIMGNDVVGQLGAGMMHCARITRTPMGLDWPHVCHNSVNALAFRNSQNNTYFSVATGVVAISSTRPWGLVRDVAFLQSHSGSTFLTSIAPSALNTKKARQELSACYEAAAMGDLNARPVDWMYNTCPDEWEINDSLKHFNWYDRLF